MNYSDQDSNNRWQPCKFVPCNKCGVESLTNVDGICLDCWLMVLGSELAGIDGAGYDAEVTRCRCGRMTVVVKAVFEKTK